MCAHSERARGDLFRYSRDSAGRETARAHYKNALADYVKVRPSLKEKANAIAGHNDIRRLWQARRGEAFGDVDILVGSSAISDDILDGGPGNDTMTGGVGHD